MSSVASVVKDVDAALEKVEIELPKVVEAVEENKAAIEKVAEVVGINNAEVLADIVKVETVVADAEIVATQAKGFLSKLFVCLRPKAE
jgi:hypothetical protein